jgi:amino acid adenylation domain-containing protein
VLRNPEAVAVVFNQRQLSYAELNRRANQIAHYLQSQGVGPERLVGVCLPRSPEMVAALLGVWKAGGAYVPLDPSYPPERLSFMVQDAAVQVLLTEKSCEHLFSSAHVNPVCLDTDWPRIASEELSNPRSGATPANLAYVMYTSGSTGTPKGAMILHRGLVNYLTWAIQTYAVEAGGSVPVHSSISFDLTVTSLYAPLLAGGQVELLAEDAAAQSLLTALRRTKNRTLVKITPAHLELLSQQLSPQEAASMTKTFVIGGENLSAEKLRLWREFAPSTRLINEYGPTETVVGCCVYEVQPGDPASGTVPIGRPIANTQLYVLDSDLQPVALGETGELYIGGAGVARGYWNRPELTRERFVPDPFSNQPEARLYKSGDLARYRPDGTLECLGRADNQVKVRGYRIELGEIEATLAGHAGVQSCAVLAREDEPGNQQLVAYVSPVKDQSLRAELYPEECPEELRAFLERRLPDYMVPAHFVILESLPLTPNGKIDRKALPAPSRETIAPAADFVAPRDSIEQLLAGIWARVLNVERVGIHDNFFDLGGHSLLAVRVVVEVDRLSRTRLPLATLLRAPTIAELAAVLRKERWAPSWSSLVPLRSGGSTAPLFLMHSHGGNVLEYHPLVNCLDPDRPVYALQARGLDGYIVRNQTLEEMAAAYIAELRTLQPEGPYFLGGFCFGGILALEAAQQLTAAGQEVALVVLIQSTHPEAKRFSASTTMLQRWWYRTTKRLDLEAENLANRGHGYILERCRYLWTRACARAAIAFDNVTGRHPAERSSLSTAYILEAVAMENGKALEKYVPRPYGGDVLLFRAVHQLSGQLVDQTLGWKRVLHGALEVCEVPGHQQNLLLEPNVLRLGRELDSRLQASCTRREPSAALPPAA